MFDCHILPPKPADTKLYSSLMSDLFPSLFFGRGLPSFFGSGLFFFLNLIFFVFFLKSGSSLVFAPFGVLPFFYCYCSSFSLVNRSRQSWPSIPHISSYSLSMCSFYCTLVLTWSMVDFTFSSFDFCCRMMSETVCTRFLFSLS